MSHNVLAARRLLGALDATRAPEPATRLESFVQVNRPTTRYGAPLVGLVDGLAQVSQKIDGLRSHYQDRIGVLRVWNGVKFENVATAWPCGTRRMMTAGHVLPFFLPEGVVVNDPVIFPAGMRDGQVALPDGTTCNVTHWVCVGDSVLNVRERDLAVFEIDTDIDPLPLGRGKPTGPICVIGYPLRDPHNQFGNQIGGTEFCCAGLPVIAPSAASEPKTGYFWHDATTEPGFSGAPLFDVATGTVIGLHVWGSTVTAADAINNAGDWNDALELGRVLSDRWLKSAITGDAAVPPPNQTQPFFAKGVGVISVADTFEAIRLQLYPRKAPPTPTIYAGVVSDRPDGRDYRYTPPFGMAGSGEDEVAPDPDPPIGAQGTEGSCAAFALAAAIETQLRRAKRGGGDTFTASVRMLDRMARRHDEWIDDGVGGTSLRAVLKGFFQNGVCPARLQGAGYVAGNPSFRMTREMAKEARKITLASYLSVPDDIATIQAAVHDTGSVIVSAHIHRNWIDPQGTITFDAGQPPERTGAHAFVITGYQDEGFVVQNSWGRDWGGWDGRDGHAIWTYEDWARNVIDAWVIRLAPRTPKAFGITAQRSGGTLPEARRGFLIGHVAHSEAEGLVEDGTLGMGMAGVAETAAFLADAKASGGYKSMALVFHDPLLGIDTVTRLAHFLSVRLKARDIYPFHLVHGLDEMETCRVRVAREAEVLANRFQDAQPDRDRYFERALAPVLGRLVGGYRSGAAQAARGEGGEALALLLLAAETSKRRVTIASIGLGAVPALACRAVLSDLAAAPLLAIASPVAVENATRVWQLAQTRRAGDIPGYLGDWPDLVAGAEQGTPRAPKNRFATITELLTGRDVADALADLARPAKVAANPVA